MTRKTSNRKGILIEEYEVLTSVEDWTEVSITYKLISKKYLKWLMPKFEQVPFASKVYYANNGVFRICMIGNEKGVIPALNRGIPEDICIFPYKGYCTIMRNEKQGYYEMEQQVIEIICGTLCEWKIEKKFRKEGKIK